MSQIFEVIMLICFGISWPASIIKSYNSRTNKGKSIVFLSLIMLGYIFGILSKFVSGNVTYVVIFYIIDILLVSTDTILYFRNRKLDKKRQEQKRLQYIANSAMEKNDATIK